MPRLRTSLGWVALATCALLAVSPAPLRAEPQDKLPATATAQAPAWQVEPYWRPVAGLSSFTTSGGTWLAVRMGATAGVHYWKAPLLGRTRALATWTTGSQSASGLEARLGTFMGPHKEYWGVEAGVDLFWDRFSAAGVDLLPASAGIDLPLNLHLGPQQIYGLVGITPALLFAQERRVDWSSTDAFGFGHEFGLQAGAGAHVGRLGAALVYSRRVVVNGVYSGWSLSLSL